MKQWSALRDLDQPKGVNKLSARQVLNLPIIVDPKPSPAISRPAALGGYVVCEAPHPQDAITYARHVAEIPCDLCRRLIRDRDRAPPPQSPPKPTIARFLTGPPLIDAQTGS